MSSINICLSLKSSRLDPLQNEVFDKDYKDVYKPALKFLYSHPAFRFSFCFNGVQLSFLQKKYPEFLEILRQLISRKQVEVIGGGYYDPVFPLLLPMDRTGQIEKYTSLIRALTGKRPRGAVLCGSIWDYSLITTFSTCGMDYVFLDDSLIPSEKLKFAPLVMSDKGKSISILPFSQGLKPNLQVTAGNYCSDLVKKVQKAAKGDAFSPAGASRTVSFQFSHQEFSELLKNGWLESLESALADNPDMGLSLPSAALKESTVKIPAFIYGGMASEIAQWGIRPYESVKIDRRYPVTVYDFFQIYPQSKALYDRMLYLSMLIQQSHGDKIRKISAREKLWEAQNGDGFICTSKGAFVSSTYRQQAYKKLTEAENILREISGFTESVTPYDYTGDSINEYVCRMQRYSAVILRRSGAIRELDIFQNFGNFADSLKRTKEFEKCDDSYERGFFIDHLFDEKEFNSYLAGNPSGSGIFSEYLYTEKKCNAQHKEILLETSALYKNSQRVSLRKRYVLSSNGMMVQYIMKNESSEPLFAKFAVESSFAQTNFNAVDFNAYKLEILSDSQKKEIDTKTASCQLSESGTLSDVEGIWLTDTDNAITFVFEPNEVCGLSFVPIIFNRPEYTSGELVPASMTFANTLFWNVELAPGMEMEKTINFSIFNQHAKKRIKK